MKDYKTHVGIALFSILPGIACSTGHDADFPASAEMTQALGSELVIYDDALANGWQNWSWTSPPSVYDLAATSPVQSGARSISVNYEGAWDGFYLHSTTAISGAEYETVRFWIHGGSSGGQTIKLHLQDGADRPTLEVSVPVTAGQWQQVEVALSSLGSPAAITGLVWQEAAGSNQPTFYLDKISLVSSVAPPPPPPLELSVNAAENRHPISPDIYGINNTSEELAQALNLPVRRWGGNSTSRYNYLYDTANRGMDWYFENVPESNPDPSLLPTGSAADQFVEQDRRTGGKSLMTIPLIGWLPKARAYACGFSVSKYGAQQSVDGLLPDCGNGVLTNGTVITGNDPTDTSVAVDPSFMQGWINHLISRFGTTAQGGVAYYNLDNEPMLWNDTHRDVHPAPTGYDEIRDRTYAYAAAIKAADPGAKTLGPVVWGWEAYFYSALDRVVTPECLTQGNKNWWQCRQDRKNHGDVPFVPWYLQEMRDYEQENGTRILDYLDVHYYPAADGISRSPAGDAANQALRLRATRSLWDASYVDESWIGEPVRLIPRMRDWVNQYYPGTKLAITEYNFGALDNMNGALAQADALGIFGREGLDLATLWWYHPVNQPTFEPSHPGAFAFRMYRNYDGADHVFGDIGVNAHSTYPDRLAIYAAQRTHDRALTLMVINKTGEDLTCALALSNMSPGASAEVYRYSAANLGAIVREADQTVAANGFTATYPANSITLIVLPPANELPTTEAIELTEGCQANTLPANDDGFTLAVALPAPVNFFGTSYSRVFINNNGNITFNKPLRTWTPFRLTADTPPIIAPFLADVDTRDAGSAMVQYGYIPFEGRRALCINWVNVGYFSGHSDKLNSFQLILAERGDIQPGDFDVLMNYGRIHWETGDASQGTGGLGGISAGAGYSSGTGQADSFFELPGSLVPGAFLDSASAGLAQTSRDSTKKGRHRFKFRNGGAPVGGTIAGDVTDGLVPLIGAAVEVCKVGADGPYDCLFFSTGAHGRYAATGLAAGDYMVRVFPPEGSSLLPRIVEDIHLGVRGTIEVDVVLLAPTGLPQDVSLSPSTLGDSGVASVYWHSPTALEVPGCPGGAANFALTQGSRVLASGSMSEAPAGRYHGSIPPLHPEHGPARLTVTIRCPDGKLETIAFDIYIDPSGVVLTRFGTPVPDAVVTLYRAESPWGPFDVVPDGSAIMSPSNRANPDRTDAGGRFRWDVMAGYYKVRAEREGCVSLSGAPYAETDALPVPPPVTDLELRLDCPGLADTTPPVSAASVSPPAGPSGWHGGAVTVELIAEDDDSGVEDIVYTLSGAQSGGAVVAGDRAEVTIAAEGITTLSWFARDRAGNAETPQSLDIRIDTTAPSLLCSAGPEVLWPPNHKLVPVEVDVYADDALAGIDFWALTSVTSSELDVRGAGNTDSDMQDWDVGTDDVHGLLRAERSGGATDRAYTLVYEAWDQAGNAASCSVVIAVPHDGR